MAAPQPVAMSLTFRGVKAFLRFTTRLYFDRIHVTGRKNLPEGVCIMAGNHPSGLLDPLVIMAALPEKNISSVCYSTTDSEDSTCQCSTTATAETTDQCITTNSA